VFSWSVFSVLVVFSVGVFRVGVFSVGVFMVDIFSVGCFQGLCFQCRCFQCWWYQGRGFRIISDTLKVSSFGSYNNNNNSIIILSFALPTQGMATGHWLSKMLIWPSTDYSARTLWPTVLFHQFEYFSLYCCESF
jgi:hypothetical protein